MSEDIRWMLYGATGYTGPLVIEEALKRGHRPMLAGRSAEKLRPLARQYGLPYVAFGLEHVQEIAAAIADYDIVLHAAGPFMHTSDHMIRACLATNTHYLDLTGEIPVFENTFTYDDAARKIGIGLISGVGFDVVPTDCLALYVAQQVPGTTQLETAVHGFVGASAGTAKSLVEMMPLGGFARRDGQLIKAAIGYPTRRVRMPDGEHLAMAIPWGDLATAYRSTGAANVTAYGITSPLAVRAAQFLSPVASGLFRFGFVRRLGLRLMEATMHGPSANARETSRSYIWARAENTSGASAEAWLNIPEPYRFTALAGVRAVEKVAELQPIGALTPAQAFGADFITEIDDCHRMDRLT